LGQTVHNLLFIPADAAGGDIMSTMVWIGGAALLAVIAVAGIALVKRQQFDAKLDGLERVLRDRGPSLLADHPALPAEVRAMAKRLGALEGAAPKTATMTQSGMMWQKPGGSPMHFTARQTNATANPDFIWRARFSPLDSMQIADYVVDGQGGLEGKLLGLVTMVDTVGTGDVLQGQLMRYLAELPWNPDAILSNKGLGWTVIDARTLKAAVMAGDVRAEVTFHLDADGRIESAGPDPRPRDEDGKPVLRPWHGRFWDYRDVEGRQIPFQGKVAWVIDGTDFVYWRGELSAWHATN
jgi:hypothetical protein